VIRIGNITFACAEPVRLAKFWAAALGYAPIEVPAEVEAAFRAAIERGEVDPTAWAMLAHPESVGPRLLFQRRPKTPTDSIPIHLDLNVGDRKAEIERLAALGATVVETKTQTTAGFTETWTVMRDPEGNGFCVQ
jgi:predicted enzyme related to lactoylglutathione lyase